MDNKNKVKLEEQIKQQKIDSQNSKFGSMDKIGADYGIQG